MADVRLRWLGATSGGAGLTNNSVYSVVGWGGDDKPIVINNNNALYVGDTLSGGDWQLVSAIAGTILFP